ncbi:MAG: hypothetical protein JXB23_09640 [Candidatus Aminicenantes bacterium]|nr:hypothetical protein [Candidatus Aminicenantes bacterium]
MKKSLRILLLCFLCMTPLIAREKLDIFGYYEAQYMGSSVKSLYCQLFTNKLRLDLKVGVSDSIDFVANFDYITYHGKKSWNVLDFLSEEISFLIPEDFRAFYIVSFSNENFLDNAYMKIRFKPFDLTLGKQQISLGTGYVWNPTDVFNIKDPLDPTYEQPGHNAVRMDVPFGASFTLTALYSPEDTWTKSGKLVQLKGRISHFDYCLIAVEKNWLYHDFMHFDGDRMSFGKMQERRRLLGANATGELFSIGTWAEFAYNWMEYSDNFYELVAGFDYTFDFQTYIMVEYYRNTLGKTDYKDYGVNDWMRFFASEQKAVSRDQVYAHIQHPATDLLNLGLTNLVSLSDGSFAFVPTLFYCLGDNVEVYAYLNINMGKEGTAYAKSLGNGGLIRIRVYF